jgi:hypothetical protein
MTISPTDSTFPTDLSALRVLEIGYHSVTAEVGCRSTFIDLGFVGGSGGSGGGKLRRLLRSLLTGYREISKGQYDLLIVRSLSRYIHRKDQPLPINLLRWVMGKYIVWCAAKAKKRGIPLAVTDVVDEDTIDTRDVPLLETCTCYFKRELPALRYNVLARIKPASHTEPALKSELPRITAMLAKFRPLPLGYLASMYPEHRLDREERFQVPIDDRHKEYDVFFAGVVHQSYTRMIGLPQLRKLADEGYRILILDKAVPQQEFWDLMSRSYLTWSPEGIGWECYRHYEATLTQSVPLINHPPNQRHRPLLEGRHAFYYDVEDDGLSRAIRAALLDKPKLLAMAKEAREHVLAHHSPVARGTYVIQETLAQSTVTRALSKEHGS